MRIADAPLLFTIDEKNRQVELTSLGIDFLSKGESDPTFYIIPDLSSVIHEIETNPSLNKDEIISQKEKALEDYSTKSKRLHCVSQLLKAYAIFEIDEDYVVIDGHVKIVDEGNGGLQGRRDRVHGVSGGLRCLDRRRQPEKRLDQVDDRRRTQDHLGAGRTGQNY